MNDPSDAFAILTWMVDLVVTLLVLGLLLHG